MCTRQVQRSAQARSDFFLQHFELNKAHKVRIKFCAFASELQFGKLEAQDKCTHLGSFRSIEIVSCQQETSSMIRRSARVELKWRRRQAYYTTVLFSAREMIKEAIALLVSRSEKNMFTKRPFFSDLLTSRTIASFITFPLSFRGTLMYR